MNPLNCAFGICAGDFVGFVVHKKGIVINKIKTKSTKASFNIIYYISRVLNDVETRFHRSEKLCLCLYKP